MTECLRVGKWFGGCKFEGRWDSKWPERLMVEEAPVAGIEALKTRTYVRDVCVRCGATIERSK